MPRGRGAFCGRAGSYRASAWCFVFALCSALLLTPVMARADDLTMEASLDRSRVTVGEAVTLTVILSSQGSVPTPNLPTPDGFDVVGRTSSTSTSISIVNGAMTTTRKVSYIYSLQANREGRFTIGPATVDYQGKTYRSQSMNLEVTRSANPRQVRPRGGTGSAGNAQHSQEIGQNLYILAEPDRRTVFVGQQVTVAYRLYTRYDLQNVRYGQTPSYTGFWAETVYDAQRLNQTSELVYGKAFRVALLKRVALFPTTTGTQPLEQLEVICDIPIRVRQKSLFDMDPFAPFGRTKQVTVRSGDLSIEVLPLPEGAPVGFAGAVGRYTLSTQASPVTVPAGDPITLRVTVSGEGNLNSVPDLIRPDTDAFRFYDPQATIRSEVNSDKVGGSKTFEYVVIPQQEGRLQLPALKLAYFDPAKGGYAVAQSKPVMVTVTPGSASNVTPTVPTLSRQEVKLLGEDIRFIKPDRAELLDHSGALYQDWRFLLLQGVPLSGFLLAFFYRRHRDRLSGDRAYARRRRSRSEANRRLAEARGLLGENDAMAYCAELSRAVTQFVADRIDVPAAGLTAESAASHLASSGVSAEAVEGVRGLLQECDFARFAPGQVTAEKKAKLLEEAESVIGQLANLI